MLIYSTGSLGKRNRGAGSSHLFHLMRCIFGGIIVFVKEYVLIIHYLGAYINDEYKEKGRPQESR